MVQYDATNNWLENNSKLGLSVIFTGTLLFEMTSTYLIVDF